MAAFGCTGGPRQRPIPGPDIEHGPDSITAARKFLQGRWALETFQVFPPGKPPITLKGAGTLDYDVYGGTVLITFADSTWDMEHTFGTRVTWDMPSCMRASVHGLGGEVSRSRAAALPRRGSA